MAGKKSLSDLGALTNPEPEAPVVAETPVAEAPAAETETAEAPAAEVIEALARLQLTAISCGGSIRLRGADRDLVALLELVGDRFTSVDIYAPTLFLRFIDATSSGCGFWPACGCSVPL